MSNKRIYLDYASLTPVLPEVLSSMVEASKKIYANPSSLYKEGMEARKALEKARKDIASYFHAKSEEIIFTSGGTEANNLAIIGLLTTIALSGKRTTDLHAITTMIEHASVLECFRYFEKLGVQ